MLLKYMALCMNLVITTLVILNFIGNVSSEDALEHSLATDCQHKGLKSQFLFQKVSISVKVNYSLDIICGDKCDGQNCICGGNTLKMTDYRYCCIQANDTCSVQGM